ncbi:MAG TPA: NADH-quinone oxidoreductase subunit NuoN [Acidiferrobacteraceae bacterium]|nr:NADH-quinone oxidoreductase subunit NuoN [Acidiferrobacteraceae bacterium]
MNFVAPDISPVIPEIFVLSMACLILVADLYLSDRFRIVSFLLAVGTLLGAAFLTLSDMGAERVYTFSNMFVDDTLSDVLKLAIYALVFVVFVYSRRYTQDRGLFRGEYFVIGLFGTVGMMVMVSASHLLTLYLGLELLALSLYTMVAFQRDSATATEAAMKYFVLGAMASGMLLYGMSMLYGVTGSLEIAVIKARVAELGVDNLILVFGLVFVVVGLAFKLGAVPFHMWVPDVYHGAATSTTLYISTAPKLAGFAILIRLLIGGLEDLSAVWQDMLIILAVLSIGIGNLIAIAQTNIKRMLAYSTIAHMGFLLLGILSATPNGYSSALFYALVYAFMSLGGFGMILMLSRKGFEAENLDDFKGLNQRSPWHAFLMLILMFSMAGIPPTVGFYAKFGVIQSLIDVGLVWLAVVAVLFAVIGAFYYLRIIKLMYFDDPETDAPVQATVDMQVLLSVNAWALILVMPWLGSIIDLCRRAIAGL